MLTSVAGALCFAGFVVLALITLVRGGPGATPRRVSYFILYALGASFAAGLAQHDEWPFSAWPLVAARLPAVVSQPRIVAVDSRGAEQAIDYRAWWPLSVDELMGFAGRNLFALDRGSRDRAARYLVQRIETARARARMGNAPGQFDRFLGSLSAPLFLLHPRLWDDPSRVPADSFVGLRYYLETWNVEDRDRGGGPVQRVLLYSYEGVR